jgi:mycofactocin glycosyltransferase
MHTVNNGLSVVIPTHNRYRSLMRLLNSLAGCDGVPGGMEVIVVDDGSSDETPGIATTAPIPISYLRQDCAGPAAARNAGWRLSSYGSVLFLDDDCMVRPDTPALLFERLGSADGVGGRILSMPGGGWFGEYMDLEGLVSHKVVDGQVFYLVTACAAFRRVVLETAGGFDVRFRHGGEDAELCYRIRRLGGTLAVDDRAVVLHENRPELSALFRTYYRHGTGQRLLLAAHPQRRFEIRESAAKRVSLRDWQNRYKRYRRESSVPKALVFVVIRAIMMAPWLWGAWRGSSCPPK